LFGRIANTVSNGSLSYLIFVCTVAALGGVLFGFDTAVISGTLTELKKQFTLGSAMEGWLVSSALTGCALGVIVAGSRLDPKTDGRPDPRPTVRENSPLMGDLLNDFDFNQKPLPPMVLPEHPQTAMIRNTPQK
jgi:hypothetical protein